MLLHAACDGAKFHRLQKIYERFRVGIVDLQRFNRRFDRHICFQRDEISGDFDFLGMVDQRLAALWLFDFLSALEQGQHVAILIDELRGCFNANTRRTRNVVHAIARERLHVDHLVRRNAELIHHFFKTDALVFHRVEERDFVGDELHQVFV